MPRVIPGRPAASGRRAPIGALRPEASPRRPAAAADLGLLTWAPILALICLLLLAVAAPAVADRIALPLAVIGVILGVPHGAVDHLLPRWAGWTDRAGRPSSLGVTGALIGAYLMVAGLAATALLLAPAAAVISFLLLSALHFGTAETAFDAERRGEGTPRPWRHPFASGAHGATVVGLLLWARPAEVDPWLRLLSPTAADAAAIARPAGLWLTALLILGQGLLTLARLSVTARIHHPHRAEAVNRGRATGRAEQLVLLELALLVATFLLAPPLAAFGVYFGCWHAMRHTGRLLDLARTPTDSDWRPAVRRLARASALPSAVALGTMAGLVLARDRAPIVVEVAVLLALTYPHSAVVWSVDLRRTVRLSRGRLKLDQSSGVCAGVPPGVRPPGTR